MGIIPTNPDQGPGSPGLWDVGYSILLNEQFQF